MPWYDKASWADRSRQLDQSQSDHFGEAFEIEPRLPRPNKQSIPAPSRPAHRIVGVFVTHDPRSTPTARRMTDVAQHGIAVEFNESELPYQLRQGDRLTRCATGERYDVLTPQSDGHGHVRASFCQIGPHD
jgi:hypothetical protein